MALFVDVHDRIVARLYQRNAQLAQEKSEADVRLRQATMLLAELQSLWMDLPQEVASAISKVLARQGQSAAAVLKEAACPSGGAQGNRWLWKGLEELFGCTSSRDTESVDGPARRPPLASTSSGGSSTDAAASTRSSEQSLDAGPASVYFEPGSPLAASRVGEMGDLICEAPDVVALVAEMDLLCRGLRKDFERVREEMDQRIEALKAEAKQHQEHTEACFQRSVEALTAELDLCKAELGRLSERMAPCFILEQDPGPKLLDAEWAGCQRASELRAQAGQSHAQWLQHCLEQRLEAAKKHLATRERDFKQDLAMIWERKSMLISRLRGRMTSGVGDGAAEGCAAWTKELQHLKKALGDLEESAMAPLRELAAVHSQKEAEQVRRLRSAISEARGQCKLASQHMDGLAQRCKAELRSQIGSANATLFAYTHLRRRHALSATFSTWALHHLRGRVATVQQEVEKKRATVADLATELHSATQAHSSTESRLQRIKAKHPAIVQFLYECLGSRAVLVAILRGWKAHVQELRLPSTWKPASPSSGRS